MAGLLGAMVAGGAKGYADQRIKSIEQQEAFDMKAALMEADAERQLRLKEAGVKMDEDANQRERDRVGGLLKSVKDPNEGKGGYETPEMKVQAKRDLLEKQIGVLKDSGDIEKAKVIQAELVALDNTDLKGQQLDARLEQIQNAFKLGEERNKLTAEANDAKATASAAKIDVARARLEGTKSGKETDTDKNYASYVKEKEAKGQTPLPRYRWDNWMEQNKAKNKDADTVTTTYDESGEILDKKVTSKKKASPIRSSPKPWERKY